MTDELARRNLAGLDASGETALLASLLSLMSDAVLVFDETGTILLANEEAEWLFRQLAGRLVDADVRMLFMPAATVQACEGSLEESLPFPLDGTSKTVICEGNGLQRTSVLIRCERLATARVAYVLVAHPSDAVAQMEFERARFVGELSRANRRLSGTLRIVLGTLDSLDVATLFSRILDEVAETMDAWAALAYVSEHSGFRLTNVTEALVDQALPSLLAYQHPLVSALTREGRTMRFDVRPPTRQQLREGDHAVREVVNEENGTVFRVDAGLLPPFACFAMVPIWFAGQLISILQVGWRHTKLIDRDDARLLDSVAEYLSVQLAGAFAAMRAQHAERLESLGTQLRERLLLGDALTFEMLTELFEDAAVGVEAVCVPLEGNRHQRTTMGTLPHLGRHSVPVDLSRLMRTYAPPYTVPIEQVDGLAEWLQSNGEPSMGVLVLLEPTSDMDQGFLMLCDADDEMLEEVDVAFIQRLAQDVSEVRAGEYARTIDKHISQALQLGMRNELQRVEGLSTQSSYSSATEAAFVGGDFYDLVRLPQGRACVVMGDVSGKGVEAASVSSAVKTALSAYAWEGLRPAKMVGLLNDFLLGFSRIETFATLFVGMVDVREGRLCYCSAGHPPALIVRASSGELVTLGVQSGVVGAFESMRYQDGEVDLEQGDMLLLYTDGVTEARNPEGAFFGEEGLRDMVSREAAVGYDGLCERLVDAVSSFSGGSLNDDVALVVMRYDGLVAED